MASIGNDSTGSTRILFYCPVSASPLRKTIRPGRLKRHDQTTWKSWIESIVLSRKLGSAIDPKAATWLAALPPQSYAKIAATGLVPEREKASKSLGLIGELFDEYMISLDIKASTRVAYNQTKRTLAEHFGTNCKLSDVTPLKAEKFRQWMTAEMGLAPSTASRRLKVAKTVFDIAVKWKLLTENPFEGIRPGSQTNSDRLVFVSQETIEKVLAVCEDNEWRAIIALARYGGLRCPSEMLPLKWADINWETKRFKVTSKKNERFESKRVRSVPLFPEVEKHLKALHSTSAPDAVFLFSSQRRIAANLRTHMMRLINRAGVKPWDRLFNNLRASRETELVALHPMHVVCEWIGNSPRIAAEHYLKVRDEDYAKAVEIDPARNPARQAPATVGNEKQPAPLCPSKTSDMQVYADLCGFLQGNLMGPQGFEP